jgi:CO dehydrogenase maturation factor
MSYIIAITGKGGVGKTTTSSLIIKRLIEKNFTPVLAVDADPNTCLDVALGVKVEKTIGRVREEAGEEAKKGMATGISKQQLIEMKIAESLVEADNFDYIAMGRPEGPGCYCYANNVLKSAIGEISSNYPYIVLDNEAGLENLSRRIVQKVDLLLIVTDASKVGLETVKRLYDLAVEMKIEFKKTAVIVNRMRQDELPETALEFKKTINADVIGLPFDDEIATLAEEGQKLTLVSDNNKVIQKIDSFIDTLGLNKK